MEILKTEDIFMSFGGIDVLQNINFSINSGEIHALIGENGAGKSTLSKILAGIYQPKSGKIFVNGSEISIPDPNFANKIGISLIHQEPLSFPNLTVAENIFVGRYERLGKKFIKWKTLFNQSKEILNNLGLSISIKTLMKQLSLADQQMVDIAAALLVKAKILIMDEPTSSLTPKEVNRLFSIIKNLKEKGTAIIFISHKLEEVFTIADKITIMRDGKIVGVKLKHETTKDEVIKLMVGREIKDLYKPIKVKHKDKKILEVINFSKKGLFDNISFFVREGEIISMAGLVGAGRSEIAQSIFGLISPDSGTIKINDEIVKITNPRIAIKHGLAYVPEDRQSQGIFSSLSVVENMTIASIKTFSNHGMIKNIKEKNTTNEYVKKLKIVLRSIGQPVNELSGGNQQKVILSRWLILDPKIIIFDEPTRGIDIGAKAEVHQLIVNLASQGKGILMISSDLPEVINLSNRVLVIHEGKKVAEFSGNEIDAERIMTAATGQNYSRMK